MSSSRLIAIVAGAALLAAWLAAANGTRAPLPPAHAPALAPDPELQAVQHLLRQTTKLSGALQTMAERPTPTRNLFQFGAVARADRPRSVPASAATPAPPVAAPPALDLEGVATNVQAGRPVLTAIIAGRGRLYLVKAGDRVANRYRVAAVSPGGVVLDDLTGGPALHLRLH